MPTRSTLIKALIAGLLFAAIVLASLFPPQRFYPAVDIEADIAAGKPMVLRFLFEDRSSLRECESLIAGIAAQALRNCPECRIARLDCTTVLTPSQASLFSSAPLPMPSGRMVNGVLLFDIHDPEFALTSCQATAAQSASSRNPVKCYPAQAERPSLPAPSVVSAWSAVQLLVALFSAWFVCWLIVRYDHLHSHFSHDHTHGGPQKYHAHPTPRIGGLAIIVGLLCAGAVMLYTAPLADESAFGLLMIAAIPAFLGGLTEDVTKKVGVVERLLLTMLSGALAAWLLGAHLNRLDLPLLDAALAWLPFAVVFTAFAVGGISNALNIIDGYNGLASGSAVIALTALAYVAHAAGDGLVFSAALSLASALLGFLAWNWPRGKIFLGDGGAYLVGFLLAELSILLVIRNPEVSVWFPLALLIYPVFETLYSIYRRKLKNKLSPGKPDNRHLHQLIHDQLVPLHASRHEKFSRNSQVAKYFWLSNLVVSLMAVAFHESTPALIAIAAGYCLLYVALYTRLENGVGLVQRVAAASLDRTVSNRSSISPASRDRS